jgi:magnesium transporter
VCVQVVSIWSNALGAFLMLAADRMKLDAALTAAPLMTTIVDTTGLVSVYFCVQRVMCAKGVCTSRSVRQLMGS